MQRNRLIRGTDGIADCPHIIRSDDSNAIQSINAIRHNIRDGYSLPRETVPVQSQVMPGVVFMKPANRPNIVVAAACDREQTSAVPRHLWRRDHGPTYWAGGSWGSGKRRLSRCKDWRGRWSWGPGSLGSGLHGLSPGT